MSQVISASEWWLTVLMLTTSIEKPIEMVLRPNAGKFRRVEVANTSSKHILDKLALCSSYSKWMTTEDAKDKKKYIREAAEMTQEFKMLTPPLNRFLTLWY